MLNDVFEILHDFFRDSSWEFFFGIAGLLITLCSKPRKQLVCSIKEVDRKNTAFIAKIYNSGNSSIEEKDYQGKGVITISTNKNNIECTIEKIGPDKMHAEVKSQNSEITIQPLLFNQNDYLDIEFSLDSPIHIDEITCHARIAGMKDDIKVFYSKQNQINWNKKEKIRKRLIKLALICEVTALVLILWVMFKN